MATNIGRKGWLGVAVETTPGVPVAATDFLAFTANTLHGMQQPISDTSARGIRDREYSSVKGKQWSEGDIEFNLDPSVAGYFLASAFGTSAQTALGGGVFSHTLARNNSNQPKALTLTNDRVIDRQYFRGSVVDKLELKVSDSFATGKASVKGYFPQTTTSGTGTTVSGTIFTWANYTVQFGATVTAATSAVTTKLTDFDVSIENNATPTWRSGSYEPATVDVREFAVNGGYTLFFESTTDRDTYFNNNKQAMVATFTGAGIGGGNTESLVLNFYSIRLDTFAVETGLANFYAEKVKFVAEYSSADTKTIDGTLINRNSNY